MGKTKIINFVRVLIFNVLETAVVFLLGRVFNVNISIRIMLMVTFFITRMLIGEPKHYKKAYNCALWSSLVFLSLYSLSNLDLLATIILTIFTGFISTGRADINDMYMWKNGSSSKYEDIEKYIKYHSFDDDLMNFEDKLQKKDKFLFKLYKYRFEDGKTFSEISELLDIETNRITTELDKIALSIRIYCKI